MNNKELGNIGEAIALKYLENQGYKLVARNWRYRHRELDLVLQCPKGILVVVEVKLRTTHSKGTGLEAVTTNKLEIIHQLINMFILKNHKYRNNQIRIDVVSVDYDKERGLATNITHIKGV
ncbi:YraN family protein [Desulfuribacillus alkaliarsenatis]|uniref:UPF0102 protein BHF68_02645 n=1 Tax=Desulfuribacillus alkaliarsenatis TaxID=766136 RepID=A0A1E5G645_9FIRM|nr:YraN family protein [Desulfuribacillus alkaliarsenatis]OEF98579.1 hypothetical protein BHF68_02645 [Desulfuribacillus alkaliarsenatis]